MEQEQQNLGEQQDEETLIEGEEGESSKEGEGEKEEKSAEKEGEEEEEKPKLTIEDLAERLEKSEKRVGYLTRKLGRPEPTPEKTSDIKDKPREEDFDANAEFIDALTDWKVDQRERKSAEERAKHVAEEREEDFYAIIESGSDKYSDFDEIVRKQPKDGGPSITPAMVEAMIEADNPVDIAYWFGQNVGESRRIARMNPLAAAREIGRLEMKLAGITSLPQKIKTTKTTSITPVTGKTTPDEKLDDLSMDDFMSSRNKQEGVA